ncbi:glycosyltransferase [Flavonifractor sp. An82]|uniref:glycosyltransferase family 2 protein n=1 Tax=Flavonifractor sp. An82 TaxID=1965660 RepID=UPI0013A616B3|nr:glycosyltransferase [Flavonifractor sp. An82]
MSKNEVKPKLSIIVPVYNVEKYLGKCVDSLLNQFYKNLEIILVDDGSSDGCPHLCDLYAQKDSRIVVIHKKNGGLASARNTGLDNCSGEYIAFLDSDDWIDPEAYDKMLSFLLSAELDIVCCEISRVQNGKEIERYQFYKSGSILTGRDVTREILLDKIGSHVVKAIYKKECWAGVRFPVGRLYEDIPVTFKVFAAAKNVGFIAEPFYKYRENDAGITLSPKPIKPYHEFLGFKDHYDYALKEYPEIVDECLANAAMYAISTCFHYYSEKNQELREPSAHTEQFLKENKRQIMAYRGFIKTRKIAISIFYFSKPLFKLMCRLFNKTGLQKLTHFDMK